MTTDNIPHQKIKASEEKNSQESFLSTCSDHNGWADFWRYKIGANVIPADTRNKKINVKWSEWQNNPIPESLHNKWKREGAFEKGLAVMGGRVWHRSDKQGEYLVILDPDKKEAIDEICSINGVSTLDQLASKFLIEQHEDDITRAHIYFYSKIPFVCKSPDQSLGLEIKSLGENGVSFCSNSVHMNKDPKLTNEYRYGIVGQPLEPVTLTSEQAIEMMNSINRVCIGHSIEYLAKNSKIGKLKPMLRNLTIDKSIRIRKGERHITLLAAADSLLLNHLGNGKSEETLKRFFVQMNTKLCEPEPLSENEVENIWQSALEFVRRVKPAVETTSVVPKELCVSQAVREKNRYVKVTGQLVGQSSVYNMISAIKLSCDVCKLNRTIDYGKKPISRSPYISLS